MKNKHTNGEDSRSTDYYYRRTNSAALESVRVVLGAVILLILVPLIFCVAGGSLSLFGLLIAVEFLGAAWGLFRFMRPPRGSPPVNPASCARPLDASPELKKAA